MKPNRKEETEILGKPCCFSIIPSDSTPLSTMLTLELKRGRLISTVAEKATVLLIDLDRAGRLPPHSVSDVTVGFSAKAYGSKPTSADFLFPVPYDTEALQSLLSRLSCPDILIPLPGCVLRAGQRIPLSGAEERLLDLLLSANGKPVPRALLSQVIKQASGGNGEQAEKSENSNSLEVLLYRLRRKLSRNGDAPIRAVRGIGYRLTLGKAR